MPPARLMAIAAACLALVTMPGACTSVPLTTLWQMRNVDPLSVEPAEIRIAVRMPDAYGVPEGGAELIIGMSRPGDDGEEPEQIEETYILVSSAAMSSPFLRNQARDGYRILTFWLQDTDYERMRNMQAKMREWKEVSDGNTTGSLSVGARPCLDGTPEGDRLPVSTYIRFAADDDFMTLTKDMDFAARTDLATLIDNIPACEKN